ncbi:MAG: LON peptidase substrate-binding domain-containing protein, partial [Acidobacteriota bacterium]|nr:LON peptidase substrate-binding domain-containing protein [Acidobacteriota bacterium]
MAEKDTKEAPLEEAPEDKEQKLPIPTRLPVLLLRDIVVFPFMIVPLFVGREKSKAAIDASLSSHRMILLLTQKKMETEDPKREEVYDMG